MGAFDYWRMPATALRSALAVGATGLSSAEAGVRLARYGPNDIVAAKRPLLLLQWLARFRNPLVLILLFASVLAGLTGELASCIVIACILLLSVTLDFVQETRADTAVQRLQQRVAIRSRVCRDGTTVLLDRAQLVPGDLVYLSAGDLVPADCRIIEANDFFVDQAGLTGEAYPVEKTAELDAPRAGPAALDARNAVLLGSSVVSGSASVLVCVTGSATQFGTIAAALTAAPPPSSFEQGLHRFGALIMRMTVLLVLFVLLVNGYFHRPWLESFLFAMALSVGLTPELLPMVMSVTLSRGAMRMAARKVVVKRLAAISDLGSMDVLCTDKTGTLTEALIRLERHVDGLGADSEQVLELAYLNSYFETGLHSPLDDAILAHGNIPTTGWSKVDEVPFDFERRRVSVLLDNGERHLLIVKGAPEDLLRLSSSYGVDLPVPLDAALRQRIAQQFDALGRDGYRVLGIAARSLARTRGDAGVADESSLSFAGFAAFLDPPKASAAVALAALAHANVKVKIVTGDNELVTRHLCRQLGIHLDAVLDGAQIAAMGEPALMARVEATTLFCRVSPAQKRMVIRALQKRGHVVGYVGDGINDAPSLHAADVGISVDGAVDVARDAADIILLRHDLRVLHDGVLEGRRTLSNVMKYLMMGTSSNFGNMFSMAGAALFLPFLPMLPMQILLNNLLYDLSELAIPLDLVDREFLRQPQRWDIALIRNFMIVMGPVSSLFDFLVFAVMLAVFDAGPVLFHTGWFIESIASQVLVIFVVRTRRSPLRSRAHPALLVSAVTVVGVAGALPFTPLAPMLGFAEPPLHFLLGLGSITLAYLMCTELVKQQFFRYVRHRASAHALTGQVAEERVDAGDAA